MKNILFTTHLDDKFIDGALVMIYSMKKNVKDFMDYPIRVLHSNVISELSLENRDRIKKLVPHVEFVDINNETYNNAPVQYPKHRVAFLSLNDGVKYLKLPVNQYLCSTEKITWFMEDKKIELRDNV